MKFTDLGDKGAKLNIKVEAAPPGVKLAAGAAMGALSGAGGHILGAVFGPIGSIAMAAAMAHQGATLGMKMADGIWDFFSDKLGGDDNAEEFAMAHLTAASKGLPTFDYRGKTYNVKVPQDKARAAAVEVRKVTESLTERRQQGISEGAEQMTPNWAKYVLDQIYNSNGDVTLTDLFDEGIPGLHDMFVATAQKHGFDPEEDFQDVEHELTLELENIVKGGHGLDEASLAQMRDFFNQDDSDDVQVSRNYDTPSQKQNPAGIPPEIQTLVNKMYHAGKISPQEFETLRKFQQQTKINVGIREGDKNPYAIGMAQAMKSTGDKPPLKKSTINKAHEIARAIKKDE